MDPTQDIATPLNIPVPEAIEFNAIHNPQIPYWHYHDGIALKKVTHLEFYHATLRAAHFLRPSRLGGRDGEVVGLFAVADIVVYQTVYGGSMTAGLVPYLMFQRLPAPAVWTMLKASNCHRLITTQQSLGNVLEELKSLVDPDWNLVIDEFPTLDDLFPSVHVEEPVLPSYPKPVNPVSLLSTCMFFHSSGTTGYPKTIPVSHEVFLSWAGEPFFHTMAKWTPRYVMSSHILPNAHLMSWCASFLVPIYSHGVNAIFPPNAAGAPMTPTPKNVLEHVALSEADCLVAAPAFLDLWIGMGSATLERLAKLRAVWYGGGPCPRLTAQALLNAGIILRCAAGASEFGLIFDWGSEEYDYMLVPEGRHFNIKWVEQDEGSKVYEMQLLDSKTHKPALHNMEDSGIKGYATSDLWVPHPTKKDHWKIVGRLDDVIVHSTGEKTMPLAMEMTICGHPLVNGGIMFGTGHAMAGFLVEPKAPIQTINIAKFRDGIWPAVEEANAQAPPASRIFKEMILVAKNPLPRAGKGTVMRKAALKMFEDDIEEAYRAMELGKSHQVKWNAEATRVWLSGEVKELVGRSVLEHEDLFQAGFDSLSATVLRQRIVGQMKESAEKIVRDSAEGVSSTLVFDYPTISTLTAFLMGGDVVSEAVPVPGAPSKQDVSFESAGAPPFRETIDEGDGNDIVIVGQSLRLPGGINDPSSFWEALISQRSDIITSIEATNRWDHASYYRNPSSSQPPQDGDIISTKAGFIDIESYDNQFFGISAAEAIFVSPSNRLVLEAAFTALEDANIPMRAVKGSNLAVFSSTIMDEGYLSMLIQEKGFGAYSRYLAEGLLPSFGSGRVSYLLDVHGPSITVDTACSGGLVAFDLAVKHLRYNPNAETALVIGAFTHAGPGHFSVLSDHGMISPNSRCATFSNGADGYVSSEGVSAMVLKTRSNAIRDGNRILAVIKASDVRHNGRTQGIAAPSIEGQVTVENRVLQMARLSPKDIHFVETHGTGTILGDSVEIRALNRVFANSHTPEAPLIIGAGKTVVGHTENVSGLVGIAKTILSFEHQIVPGIAHLTNENRSPSLDVTSIPLSISPIPATLPNNSRHSALVLANGISGTVAAAILQSPPPSSISSTHGSLTVAPFILSAKTPEALREYVKSYVDFCQQYSSQDAGSVCYTASVGREYYRYRFGCTVTSMKDLADKLTVDAVQPHMNGTPRPVILAFPGQGLHYPGMAAGLSKLPTFRTILEQNARLASKVSSFDVIGYMTATETENFSAIGGYSQLAIFVFQVTLGQWLQNIGIQISAVVGHSLGEIAASVISGALSFEMGLDLVIWREALLVSPASSPSGMALVAASEDEIRSLLQETPDLVIAIYNNPGSHVVSGPLKQIEAFVVATKAHGLRCTELNVAHGFHSPSIAGGLAGLETWSKLHSDQLSQPTIPFVSSTYGRILKSIPPNYWATNARDPVRFDQATFAIGEVYPQSIILDVGPQPAIYPILSSSHNFAPLAVTSRRGGDQLEALFSALAQLFTHGIDLDWNMVFRGLNMQTTSIPTYPFQRNRHYPNIRPTRNSSFSHSTAQTHSVEEITLPSSPTTTQADKVFVWAIQAVLGLGPTDTLDFSATLSGIGVDSISFAHIQSKVKVATGSVVPVDWFSDNYTLQDMVSLLK